MMVNGSAPANASTYFVNVQNVVLDSIGQLWIIDSGIPSNRNAKLGAIPGGAKIISFNQTTGDIIKTYVIPQSLCYHGMNTNDLCLNNSLRTGGYGFITDESTAGSVLAVDLDTGSWIRRLCNTTHTRADEGYVGNYNGKPIYSWNGTKKSFIDTGADGIALASGLFFWGVLGSRRYFNLPQSVVMNYNLTDQEVHDAVVFPGQCASEQAGLTADDHGRLYITASEQNAWYYVDTQQSEVNETVNGVALGGSELVDPKNHVLRTLIRNAFIEHADSAAIGYDEYLYFNVNQLEFSPGRQYNNTDKRHGPFRVYRLYIGRGPAE